jgi:hypothetical protein
MLQDIVLLHYDNPITASILWLFVGLLVIGITVAIAGKL